MKYGLLYYKKTDNIGDDIQTYAQKRFLPRVDYLIDREELGMFIPSKKEAVSVIMNAWYIHNKIAWPPSPFINPLLISMHFTSNPRLNGEYSYLNSLGGEYLRERGPVGCRDEKTLELLKKHNIDGYFSGCMTLTLKPFKDLEKKDYVCLVDVDEEIVKKIKSSTKREVRVITHALDPQEYSKLSFKERMQKVEELLKTYQQAHLVITTRLHAMLPSVALQTPVILIHDKKYEEDRLGTFTKFVTNFSSDELKKINLKNIIEKPKNNDTSYVKISKELEKRCENFIKHPKTVNKLPSISEFKRNVEEKKYYSDLYISCINQCLNNIKECDYYYEEKEKRDRLIEQYIKDNLIYKEQINKLKFSLDEKNQYINNLLNSRSFKMFLKFKKLLNPLIVLYKKYNHRLKVRNEIVLRSIEIIGGNKVLYHYDIKGENSFKKLFWLSIPFSVEYNENIEDVPESILVIPFICNVLPIIWLTNSKLYVKAVDKSFYSSISSIKKAYEKMLPNIEFKGRIHAKEIKENSFNSEGNTITFFSGGVDSFSTLINNLDMKPTLVTICGGDIDFDNEKEWNNVKAYASQIGNKFNLKNLFIKSSLRAFIDNTELEKQFNDKLKDNWWHAVQHGIGMISLVAPYCYKHKVSRVLFPSTYTENEKNIVCASRPEIDESLKFASTSVSYDGKEFNRQQKVNNICNYIKKTNTNFIIRVCYRSLKGDNCCNCEKCYRTIMSLIAEKVDPRKFGFKINKKNMKNIKKFIMDDSYFDNEGVRLMWKEIKKEFMKNKNYWSNINDLSWIIDVFDR